VLTIDKSNIQKTVLDNGVTVISEKIESVRSIAVGVWVKSGSRAEKSSENGTAHFLEHMIFKGTRKRSPLKIAQSLESLGGHLNAFTGKEVTCYFGNALDSHLKNTVEVLADIVCHSTFPEKEIDRERTVILEEIKSTKDTPEDYVFDIFQEKIFPKSSLGRPILGEEKTINRLQRDDVLTFWQKNYASENVIISAAGNLKHEKLIKLAEKYFDFNGNRTKKIKKSVKTATGSTYFIDQPINQAHLCMGGKGIPYISDDRFPLMILNTYLGGGMSSRLFQQVREKRGLAYSVYSFLDFYSDVGLFGIYAGTDPQNLDLLQKVLKVELQRVVEDPIKKGDLNKIKNQLKGNLVLALESTSRRMSRLAKNEIYFGKYIDLDSLITGIDEVQESDVLNIARKVIRPEDFITVTLRPKKQ